MPSPLEWSAEMDGLFGNCVVTVIRDDPRTDWTENLSLGYPFEVIREQVLQKGLADFSQGHADAQYGPLTAGEKALLYCFVNFKKHFFSALATFQEYRVDIEGLFSSEEKPLVVDIGCGPATAGLALADMLRGKSFDYLGIDSAEPMRTKAASLWEAARVKGLPGPYSTGAFQASWTDLAADQVSPGRAVLVVFSYCCASHTLTLPALQSLAHTVLRLIESRARVPLALAYMNSTNPLAGVKYDVFRQSLGLDLLSTPPASATVEYWKKRGSAAISREEFVRQVLRIPRRT